VSAEDEVAGKAAEHIIARVVEQAGVHDAETLVQKIERVSTEQVAEAEKLAATDALRRGENRAPGEILADMERSHASRLTEVQRARARAALDVARTNEESITPRLQQVVQDTPGIERLAGEGNWVKTQGSLDRKLGGRLGETTDANALDRQFTRELDKVNDMVRYTMVAPESEYATATRDAIASMKQEGFVLEGAPKDAWANPTGYRGVNSTWLDPATGQRFEMQFHTPESLAAKEGTHEIYDFARVADQQLAPQFDAVQNKVFDLVPIPDGTSGKGNGSWLLGGGTS